MPRFSIELKRWRFQKFLLGLMIFELPLTVAVLTLFGIADPDTYRDKLWLDGFINGFNSSPSQPIYDLVNGKSMVTPLVWSS
jgi:Sec-independent protein secretion pathway component TatC